MIIEQRTYTLRPGSVLDYLDLYEREGLEVQRGHLERLVGYYHSEIGELNQIIHMWAYEDLEDRRRRRTALFKDPRWNEAVRKLLPYIERMENRILLPAPFSPQPSGGSSTDGPG